jgi:hypothetical protein
MSDTEPPPITLAPIPTPAVPPVMAVAAPKPAKERLLLYHFTDTRNVDSIRAEGLWPLRELREKNVEIPAPGGNDWSWTEDKRRGLDGFVHLCLLTEQPMQWRATREGRIQRTAWLRIDPSVLDWDGVEYTPDVANKSGVDRIPFKQALEQNQIDVEALYDFTKADLQDREKLARRAAAERCEVLVPRRIPPALISFPS